MTFNLYKLIKYHLYLLQLENYELGRFWKLLNAKGWLPPKQQRKDLVWTKKAVLLFVLAELLIILVDVFVSCAVHSNILENTAAIVVIFLAVFFILQIAGALFLSVAAVIVWPADFVTKQVVIGRAKSKISSLKNLKIIGIAGSYGKTTMKEVLGKVLSTKYRVLTTPESVNTPVGIARWILRELDDRTNIAIVEMGEHYKGDIADLCDIARPDISIVTGINEAHLERMRSLQNVAATVFEILGGAKQNALVVLNGDDKNVIASHEKFLRKDQKMEKFSVSALGPASFDVEKLLWKVNSGIGELEIHLLGEYALGDVNAAIKIAKSLGLDELQIRQAVAQIKPVVHRPAPSLRPGNILVIDDAYNGNSDGAEEAIKLLSKFSNRRKIYITPGLVEAGPAVAEVHRKIGQQLASVADVVILIKNSVTGFIAEGIGLRAKGEVGKPEVIWFDSAQEAHASLNKILKPNDVILFQNDWGDQYL